MLLIEPKVSLLPQEDPKKQIELAGRTCYKSESKGDANAFVDMLIKNGHLSMLEHGTIYLVYSYPRKAWVNKQQCNIRYYNNLYSKVVYGFDKESDKHIAYITTNYRVIYENAWEDDLQYMSDLTDSHIPRYSIKFICSRACAQQLTRHRAFSFAMESQRYCNYSKEKFGKTITFIKPEWYKGESLPTAEGISERLFYFSCKEAEGAYFDLLREGRSPQEARVVLPNATKTELIMTGDIRQWQQFLSQRADNSTGKADAEIHRLALEVKKLIFS